MGRMDGESVSEGDTAPPAGTKPPEVRMGPPGASGFVPIVGVIGSGLPIGRNGLLKFLLPRNELWPGALIW